MSHTPVTTPASWLWPDRTIWKQESRLLRDEHNALVNSHAALMETLRIIERQMDGETTFPGPIYLSAAEANQIIEAIAAVDKATL